MAPRLAGLSGFLPLVVLLAGCEGGDQTEPGPLDESQDLGQLEISFDLEPGESTLPIKFTIDSPLRVEVDQITSTQLALTVKTADGSTTANGQDPSVDGIAVPSSGQVSATVANVGSDRAVGRVIFVPQDGPGGEESCPEELYSAWFGLFQQKLSAAGSVLDAQEKQGLEAAIAQKPCTNTTPAMFSEWFALFQNRLSASGSVLDDQELAFLELVVAARAAAPDDESYAAWFGLFTTRLNSSGSVIDDNEGKFLDFVLRVRPPGSGLAPYTSWLDLFKVRLSNSGSVLDEQESAFLALIGKARPPAVVLAAYEAWLAVYEQRLATSGSVLDQNELAFLQVIDSNQPCVQAADLNAAKVAFNKFAQKFPASGLQDAVNAAFPGSCTGG